MYTYIDNKEDLSFLNKELLEKPFIGVDTEFRRTTKENMKLALLQINDGQEIFLIDTILIGNPNSESEFLFSDSVTKIFHSCKEDLEAIYSWTNKKMTNIFDTQIANALLGGDFSISYQGLVEKKLGIVLEKKETRSNWLRRPLSDSQLKYATLDVEYLIHVYLEQLEEMRQTQKIEWQNEDILKLIRNTFDHENHFHEISRSISKAEENNLLSKFNLIVEKIAKKEKINPTLFFSKKNQKDFLRLVFEIGLDNAFKEITLWRRELIHKSLIELLK